MCDVYRKTILLVVLVLSVASSETWSQSTFIKRYGGGFARSIVPTEDAGYLIVGHSTSKDGIFAGQERGFEDAFAIKIDGSGVVQWSRLYGGASAERAHDVVALKEGGFLVVGFTSSNNGDFSGLHKGENDALMMRLSSDGDLLWSKSIGGSQMDYAQSISLAPDGGYYITGSTNSNDKDFQGRESNSIDVFVIKVNSDGDILWRRTYGGLSVNVGFSVATTESGGCIVVGSAEANGGDFNTAGLADIFAIKIDDSGTLQWSRTYGGSQYDRGYSVATTPDGGFAITGTTNSNDIDFAGQNKGGYDIYVLKIDSVGDVQWTKVFGGSSSSIFSENDDVGYSISYSSSNGYIITGNTTSNDVDFDGLKKGLVDMFVINLDNDGGQKWLRTIGGSLHDQGLSSIYTSDGGCVVVGGSDSRDGDFSVVPDTVGGIVAVKIDSNGMHQGSTSIEDGPLVSPGISMSVFPNPTQALATVNYALSSAGAVRIDVLDCYGTAYCTLVNEEKGSGTYSIRLDVQSFPLGLYHLRMMAGGILATTQVVVIR